MSEFYYVHVDLKYVYIMYFFQSYTLPSSLVREYLVQGLIRSYAILII